MKRLHGVVTAVPSLFDETESLKLDWMKELLSFLLSKKVHGLYPCGTTGEMLYLSAKERKDIAELAVKTRNEHKSSTDIFIHTGSARTDETIELTNHAADCGADGAGVVTPWYFRLDDEAIFLFYDKVFKNVPKDFPIYVYNIPQLSGNDLKPDTVKRLKDKYSNLTGIKYSFSDFNRLKEYLNIDGVETLVGADVQMIESMLIGASGTVSGLSSVFPEIFVKLYELFMEKKYKEAVELEKHAYKLGCIMQHGGNLSMFKAGLTMRGLHGGTVRNPLRELTTLERKDYLEKLAAWESGMPQ